MKTVLTILLTGAVLVAEAASAVEVAAFGAKAETRYDFCKRLSAPRERRPNGFAGDPIAKDETVVGDDWTLVV